MVLKSMVSVIVPVYNVEGYLPRCLDSIVSQTYKNLEIILVDDGSTDSSGRICDEYADKDIRIRVIHQINSGLPEARNSGLKVAKGDYIIMPDGDDALHPQMIEILYNLINSGDYDFSMCYGEKIYHVDIIKERVQRLISVSQVSELSSESCMRNLWQPSSNHLFQYCVVWNKLYKRVKLEAIGYFADTASQDTEYNNRVFQQTNKAVLTTEYLYYYIQRDNSIQHQKNSLRLLNDLNSYDFILSDSLQTNKLYRSYILDTMFHRSINIRYSYLGTQNYYIAKDNIKHLYIKNRFEYFESRYIPFYKKLKFVSFYYLPYLYSAAITSGEFMAKKALFQTKSKTSKDAKVPIVHKLFRSGIGRGVGSLRLSVRNRIPSLLSSRIRFRNRQHDL